MGTRSLRIRQEDIQARLKELDGQSVQVVLQDGTAFAGKIMPCLDNASILLNSQAPNRAKKGLNHLLKIADIQFIYLDKISPW